MKKLIIVYVVLIVAVILLFIARGGNNLLSFIPSLGGTSATAEINGEKINLLIADSNEEREKGLSGRNKLDDNQGMLFIFEEKGKYPFWMKNMKFSIDIIYIDENKVAYIVRNAALPSQAPTLNIYTPDAPANYVLELNAGQADKLKIEKGTTVKFTNLPKQ